MRLTARKVALAALCAVVVFVVDSLHRAGPEVGRSKAVNSRVVRGLQGVETVAGVQARPATDAASPVKLTRDLLRATTGSTTIDALTSLDDVFISVKTTQKFHESRLALIVDTWFQKAKNQTYFFTDADDPNFQKKTGNHMINTKCSAGHQRTALCCKMSLEFDRFIESNKRWFCHMDDDTYLNVQALVSLLQQYDHTEDYYLGKPSISHALEIKNIEKPGTRFSFWFATGGAGFCLSQGLALKLIPYLGGGRLLTLCQKIRLPDDCTIGYAVYQHVRAELTKIKTFHSHLEGLWQLTEAQISKQITFSYFEYGEKNGWNRVRLSHYKENEDPTRFWSIHCTLYPELDRCKRK